VWYGLNSSPVGDKVSDQGIDTSTHTPGDEKMTTPVDKRKLRMLQGEFIGTDNQLYGRNAWLMVEGERGDTTTPCDTVKAQFKDKKLGDVAHGWHEFRTTQFEIVWDHDKLQFN
jgi:hypothetical protein